MQARHPRNDSDQLGRSESRRIERLMSEGRWTSARSRIVSALRKHPNDHFLLSCLSLTYYEQDQFTKALESSRRAIALKPKCPASLWEHAGNLSAVGRHKEAIACCRSVVRRSLDSLAYGECGDGLAYAKTISIDCRFQLGFLYYTVGDIRRGMFYTREYIRRRGRARSAYTMSQARRLMDDLRAARSKRKRERAGGKERQR